MGMFQRLFNPQRIVTAANEYHLSAEFARRSGTPVRIERVFAQKDVLGDTWSLYSVTDHPLRPVAHFAAPGGFLGFRGYHVIDNRWGRPEKIAGKLSLTEAFERVRTHEENPATRSLQVAHGRSELLEHLHIRRDGALLLIQKKPVDDSSYWRNMAPPQI